MLRNLVAITILSLFSGCSFGPRETAENPVEKVQITLQQAVFYGSHADIQNALDCGADINKPIGVREFLPLEGAILMDDFETFEFLLTLGAKANARCISAAKLSRNKQFWETLNKKPDLVMRSP